MRNYYKVLGLERLTKPVDMRQTIESLGRDRLAQEDDLHSVLMNDKWCAHYRRAHLQYEAIAAAIKHPAMRNIEHTHNWDRRVVEFDSVQDSMDPGTREPGTRY